MRDFAEFIFAMIIITLLFIIIAIGVNSESDKEEVLKAYDGGKIIKCYKMEGKLSSDTYRIDKDTYNIGSTYFNREIFIKKDNTKAFDIDHCYIVGD